MSFAYIVRCTFTTPAREPAWNAWYSGPKIEQMLQQPYFRTCQRFHRTEGNGRDYLALWTVQSPEALRTPEYLSQWGFSEWSPFITDWSRDLFDARAVADHALAVPPDGALQVISFDGMSADDAAAERDELAKVQPKMWWLPIAGLDRHTPLIGLCAVPNHAAAQRSDGRMQQATYRPITAYYAVDRPPG